MPETTPDRPGRNEPCHCGSGKKYKRCCLAKDDAAAREEQAATAEATEPATAEAKSGHEAAKPKRPGDQPWKRGTGKDRAFQRFMTPPKRGGG